MKLKTNRYWVPKTANWGPRLLNRNWGHGSGSVPRARARVEGLETQILLWNGNVIKGKTVKRILFVNFSVLPCFCFFALTTFQTYSITVMWLLNGLLGNCIKFSFSTGFKFRNWVSRGVYFQRRVHFHNRVKKHLRGSFSRSFNLLTVFPKSST